MSVIPSSVILVTSKVPETLIRSHLRLNRNDISRCFSSASKNSAIPGMRRQISRVFCSNSVQSNEEDSSEKTLEKNQLSVLQSWDVPWGWQVTLCVMMPYLMSIVLTGIVGSAGLTGSLQPYSEDMQNHLHNIDEVALRLFMDQFLKTAAKLSVLYVFVSPYQPFPNDIFSYRWIHPFNLQYGWILWSGGGLIIASSAVFLLKAFTSGSSAGQMQNEADSLMRLLPLIGASNTSTVCLLGILGIFAPFCEETLYRGFLMTSLTKWLPVPVSVAVSSAVFTLVHQSPGKSLEIFIFGTVLGLVYAQTRNLLAPITMHACWNLGVILTLMFLQSQGYEIQKYIL
ncbi:uncharacterized protein LOC143877663 isoform X2 [Tasmannia lanceolata]|uniref:uncharacterized protein LOC143877663 isoform X2 n=1 Tax=Tasmannia lanceolata TaxID=3420 RepID=UPI004063BCE0